MMTSRKNAKYGIAIIGGGPTGLSALENLTIELNRQSISEFPQLVQFDSAKNFGSGQVYSLGQPSTNWLNIPERSLWIKGRQKLIHKCFTIPAFPSYHDWIGWSKETRSENDTDYFPARSHLGKYLNLRYRSIAEVLERAGILLTVNEAITEIDVVDDQFHITSNKGNSYKVDQAALAIGHQPTELSAQLKKWEVHAAQHANLSVFSEPYPVDRFISKQQQLNQATIALRGFGLAMIDVVRALSEGLGGKFKVVDPTTMTMSFKASKRMPKKIVPFSLDGLPMAPKPLNGGIDNWFQLSDNDKRYLDEYLKLKLEDAQHQESHQFLVDVMAKTVSSIYLKLGHRRSDPQLPESEIATLASSLMLNENLSHQSIVPVDISAVESMRLFVKMATGCANVSLDYCLGQVWRHSQPLLYERLSFTKLPVPVILKIIELDERMKRYSYGPPVASIQQLLALFEAKILTLNVVDDPDIEMSEKGWVFKEDGNVLTANILINTVLDAPRLSSVNSPILKSLYAQNIIKEMHEELGALTYSDGFIMDPSGSANIRLAILGRLANGSVIGIDSLDECFSDKIRAWARSAVMRYQKSIML